MATTLSQIKTRIRQRIDKVNSTYIEDSELNSYVNASYAELYDKLIEAYEDYFVSGPTSFTLTSSDAGIYPLPSDFYKLKGVDAQSGGDWIALYPHNWNDRNQRNQRYRAITYRMIGGNLRLEPLDNTTGTYRIWYVPSYTALASDSDVIDSTITRNNWEEYIVIDVGIKILAKEESNTSQLNYEKQQLIRRLENIAGDRDIDKAERVSDVSSMSSNRYDPERYQ